MVSGLIRRSQKASIRYSGSAILRPFCHRLPIVKNGSAEIANQTSFWWWWSVALDKNRATWSSLSQTKDENTALMLGWPLDSHNRQANLSARSNHLWIDLRWQALLEADSLKPLINHYGNVTITQPRIKSLKIPRLLRGGGSTYTQTKRSVVTTLNSFCITSYIKQTPQMRDAGIDRLSLCLENPNNYI